LSVVKYFDEAVLRLLRSGATACLPLCLPAPLRYATGGENVDLLFIADCRRSLHVVTYFGNKLPT